MARITFEDKKKNRSKIFNMVQGSFFGITAMEIATEINMPKRTVYNYLYELEAKNLLYRDGHYWVWDYGY